MRLIHKDQKGLTLVELLVALPIMAIVVLAASAVMVQVIQSAHSSAHMVVLRQVQTAGYWVSRDALQVQEEPDVPAPPGIPFTLRWTEWDNSEAHEVVYSISLGDINQLQRQETVHDKDGNLIGNITTVVGQYIDYIDSANSKTRCNWDINMYVLTFTVTADIEGEVEARTYEVKPRALA